MRDTFVPQEKLNDPSKLYAPGRVFHIVERQNCRCGRLPPRVRTAVPSEGRFEHVVLSCNATSDHGIIWIEREAQKALDLMEQEEESTSPPSQQRMLRVQETSKSVAEHEINAMEHVVFIPEGTPPEDDAFSSQFSSPKSSTTTTPRSTSSSTASSEWDELVETFLGESEEDGDHARNVCSDMAVCLQFNVNKDCCIQNGM
ncbi:hypothetical protein GUJ93_ZPchr0013g37752 [Zizania palustris]|uniref:Uncharacterized protein n=1 Tax=Zizania palustris TaxID=103762 RepID=A0A8J5WYK1_ZIZPA|nr:hypothetical protein GUJ93_ZPchr0013g37752 [Zizania palustris]